MNEQRLERALQLFSHYPPQTFLYDTASHTFAIGDQRIVLSDYQNYVAPPSEPIDEEQAMALIVNAPLVLNVFNTHFQLPRLYNWLSGYDSSGWKEINENVTDIMIDAYADVSNHEASQLQKGTHWGFGVNLYRPGHPVFNVIGDCACYGVTPDGIIFGEEYWNSGLAEYSAHNIDWPAQRVALYAGAGALAARCLTDPA